MSPYGPRDKWWNPGQEQLRRVRYADQVRLVRQALRDQGTAVRLHPDVDDDHLDEVEFMYRADTVLTSDSDASRVRRLLDLPETVDKHQEGLPDPINGLTVLKVGDAAEVVDRVDRAIGKGVVRYDTVVHVSPAVSYCPATEPDPAKEGPEPAVNSNADAGRNVRVAVVDTGIVPQVVKQHSWLDGVTGEAEAPPAKVGHYRGHGTFVAGVLRTMAPSAHVDVWSLFPHGGAALESELAPRLVDVFLSNVDIISMSAGVAPAAGNSLLSLQAFYDNYLKGSNTLLVCAAGNDAGPGPFEPASQGWPVAVGALDADGSQAGYSNYGAWVDVWARGSDIVNAYPKGKYTYMEPPMVGQPDGNFTSGLASWSGTSFATPLVSGLIAARMSTYGENARQAWAHLSAVAAARAAANGGRWVLRPGDGD
ncbi:S8/S53 family peptidase [Intrasporangium sp.]|uniref:S8 family peptidase n=1 Tax=Intrasporangium sp. TaxID=1925024 RepID=UPI00293B4235|nr:S8/S53 family peptidase [Intrasporangium sp.]MDV3219935.1 S8/S53 family peptidase [Intrasporangium sp.]